MAIYWWPASAVKEVEQWISNFIWFRDLDKAKPIVVKWDEFCKPFKGGLGLRKMRNMNKALIRKLCWEIKMGNTLFRSFMKAKYFSKCGIPKGYTIASSIWLGIKRVWDSFSKRIKWFVGNGTYIDFWSDT
ncbi:hypothetical protein AMTRI_Chr08g164440 [Amborella trichopoda]